MLPCIGGDSRLLRNPRRKASIGTRISFSLGDSTHEPIRLARCSPDDLMDDSDSDRVQLLDGLAKGVGPSLLV